MIRRPASCLGSDPVKPQLGQLEFLDKYVDHSGNSVICPRSEPSTKRLIESLRKSRRESYRENQMKQCVFTQAGLTRQLAAQ
jgi:hypothetical protein